MKQFESALLLMDVAGLSTEFYLYTNIFTCSIVFFCIAL